MPYPVTKKITKTKSIIIKLINWADKEKNVISFAWKLLTSCYSKTIVYNTISDLATLFLVNDYRNVENTKQMIDTEKGEKPNDNN